MHRNRKKQKDIRLLTLPSLEAEVINKSNLVCCVYRLVGGRLVKKKKKKILTSIIMRTQDGCVCGAAVDSI